MKSRRSTPRCCATTKRGRQCTRQAAFGRCLTMCEQHTELLFPRAVSMAECQNTHILGGKHTIYNIASYLDLVGMLELQRVCRATFSPAVAALNSAVSPSDIKRVRRIRRLDGSALNACELFEYATLIGCAPLLCHHFKRRAPSELKNTKV